MVLSYFYSNAIYFTKHLLYVAGAQGYWRSQCPTYNNLDYLQFF